MDRKTPRVIKRGERKPLPVQLPVKDLVSIKQDEVPKMFRDINAMLGLVEKKVEDVTLKIREARRVANVEN